MKKIKLVFISSIMPIILSLGCCYIVEQLEKKESFSVVINEVCGNNKTLIRDGIYDGSDYIELYNSSAEEVLLNDCYLSDDSEELKKFQLRDIVLKPYDYAVFYSLGTEAEDVSLLNFSIDSAGETIFLSDENGRLLDTVYVPGLDIDVAYARKEDGSDVWKMKEASVGSSNNEKNEVPVISLKKPSFSHDSGFYDDEFLLTIQAGEGETVYYTTDGSLPTEESLRYENGIVIKNVSNQPNAINAEKRVVNDWKDYTPATEPVDKGMVIRAVAVDDEHRHSETITGIFFVDLEKYKEKKVISVVASPKDLYGDQGIFVTGKTYDDWYLTDERSADGTYNFGWTSHFYDTNFWKRGRSWETASDIKYFADGTKVIDQKGGIRTQGNYTRMFEKKNIQIFSREDYSGSDFFEAPLFDSGNSHALIVSMFPFKAYYLELAKGRSLEYQDTIGDCAVFVNGEYWYDGVIMEKIDEVFFEQHFGVSSENTILLKEKEAAVGESYKYLYDEFVGYIRNEDLTSEEKCEWLYTQMDVQSFIDWMCYNLYLCNDDIHFEKNNIFWRTVNPEDSAYGDCKWRWLVYDMDHAVIQVGAEIDSFAEFNIIKENPLYDVLKSDEAFRKQFVITFMDMINTNFSLENVEKVLKKSNIDLSYHNSFFLKRADFARESLKEEFELSGTLENIKITTNDSDAGKISVNTSEVNMTSGGWNGQYFTDYPVTVKVSANPGYRFAGWSGNISGNQECMELEIPTGGLMLHATFEKE